MSETAGGRQEVGQGRGDPETSRVLWIMQIKCIWEPVSGCLCRLALQSLKETATSLWAVIIGRMSQEQCVQIHLCASQFYPQGVAFLFHAFVYLEKHFTTCEETGHAHVSQRWSSIITASGWDRTARQPPGCWPCYFSRRYFRHFMIPN